MQPDRAMMEVQTDLGPEMRDIECIDLSESWMGNRQVRGIEAIQPHLHDGERAFHCIDGTVYVVKGAP